MGAEKRAWPSFGPVRSDRWSWGLVPWHVCGAALVVLVPTLIRLGLPFWELPARLLPQVPALAAGYLGVALIATLAFRTDSRWSFLLAAAGGALAFGGTFLLLVYLPGFDYSRLVVLMGASLGTGLAVLPYYLSPRALRWGLIGLVIAVAASTGWSMRAPQALDQVAGAETRDRSASLTGTALHNVRVDAYTGFVEQVRSSGGGIVAVGDRAFIIANGVGEFRWLMPSGETFYAEPTGLPAPLDWDAFVEDNSAAFEAGHFRIMDLLVDSTTTPRRLLVSHYHWDSAGRCVMIRVSSIPIPEPPQVSESAAWEPLFTTQPCVPVEQVTVPEGLTNHAGGRLAWAPDGRLLFSVGDLSVEGPDGLALYPQRADADYGKILVLDRDGRASPYSTGLRNPEGLLVARDGTIWETEHGPTGGDELNAIVVGADYGWPEVTYGTASGIRSGAPLRASPTHGDYVEPVFSWLPSIGVSNLIEITGDEFPEWAGDLLVASLNGQSLFRVRIRDGRVVYAERIQVGGRLRDLAQDARGRVLVWRDDATLLVLANAGPDRTGEVVFAGCATCHESVGGQPSLGPDLRGVYGRQAGTQAGFEYSPAFAGLDLRWSPETLAEFLANPTGYVPGTRMDVPGLSLEDRLAVTDYLWVYERSP